jgi:hypothetical protein
MKKLLFKFIFQKGTSSYSDRDELIRQRLDLFIGLQLTQRSSIIVISFTFKPYFRTQFRLNGISDMQKDC